MTESLRLQAGEWRIADTPEGWVLRFRHRLTPLDYIRATWRRCLVFLPLAFAVVFVSTWRGSATLAVGTAAISVLMLWLLGFYGKVRPNHIDANRQEDIAFTAHKVELPAGVFEVSLLDTLRQDPSLAAPGRVSLVFTGTFDGSVIFIGWPGMAPGVAESVISAVHERLLG
jgi:hypothetical protein